MLNIPDSFPLILIPLLNRRGIIKDFMWFVYWLIHHLLLSVGVAGNSGAIQPIAVINARKGSDLQKLVEESEGSVASDQKGDAGSTGSQEDVVTVQTKQVHPCTNFYTSLRMAYVL